MCGGHLWALACPATGPFLLLISPLLSCEQLPFPHSTWDSQWKRPQGRTWDLNGARRTSPVPEGKSGLHTQIQKGAGGLGPFGAVSK